LTGARPLLRRRGGMKPPLGGAPIAELTDYFALMGVFGVVFTAGGLGLFELLIEG
jgi:heme exporter protein B